MTGVNGSSGLALNLVEYKLPAALAHPPTGGGRAPQADVALPASALLKAMRAGQLDHSQRLLI